MGPYRQKHGCVVPVRAQRNHLPPIIIYSLINIPDTRSLLPPPPAPPPARASSAHPHVRVSRDASQHKATKAISISRGWLPPRGEGCWGAACRSITSEQISRPSRPTCGEHPRLSRPSMGYRSCKLSEKTCLLGIQKISTTLQKLDSSKTKKVTIEMAGPPAVPSRRAGATQGTGVVIASSSRGASSASVSRAALGVGVGGAGEGCD